MKYYNLTRMYGMFTFHLRVKGDAMGYALRLYWDSLRCMIYLAT